MKPCGLVLQGGGALGAYEYGAVARLVEEGWQPTVVSGVSIGAINAAAIAGARDGDIIASLHEMWSSITLPRNPFIAPALEPIASMFGNPNFYALRHDVQNMQQWTNLCDVSPMRRTLERVIDFDRLNDTARTRVVVTATNVATGELARFSNVANRLGPDHILASGSLPPGFPMTKIDGSWYWDGGLFDNTPLRPLVELLTEEEARTLPIFVIDLFPMLDSVPGNLLEVKNRLMELSFENRFWDEYGGPDGLVEWASVLESIDQSLPAEHPVRRQPAYRRMMDYRALRNLHVIPSPHVPMTGGMDFSQAGVQARYDRGYGAASMWLRQARGIEAASAARAEGSTAAPSSATGNAPRRAVVAAV